MKIRWNGNYTGQNMIITDRQRNPKYCKANESVYKEKHMNKVIEDGFVYGPEFQEVVTRMQVMQTSLLDAKTKMEQLMGHISEEGWSGAGREEADAFLLLTINYMSAWKKPCDDMVERVQAFQAQMESFEPETESHSILSSM